MRNRLKALEKILKIEIEKDKSIINTDAFYLNLKTKYLDNITPEEEEKTRKDFPNIDKIFSDLLDRVGRVKNYEK